MRTRTACFLLACVAAGSTLSLEGQMRVNPLDDERGHVGLGLALRHLANTGIAMQATAHPDDENNGLLVKMNRLEGYRTALATATRGNGGQNEIGPELFEALGVLRTEELEALHRFDGTEQYFTRAVDFGYSFSTEETFAKWGRDEIIEDYVHLIRMIRPDIVFALSPTGGGGGQHHQASSILAREAWKLAGDPTKFPDQIAAGLRPWQPAKFYIAPGFGAAGVDDPGMLRIDLDTYDDLLGKTCFEIGIEARSMHKCQGQAALLALPGPSATAYQLVESTIPGGTAMRERSLFDGIDTSLAGLARFAGLSPAPGLAHGLGDINTAALQAQQAFDRGNDADTLPPLAAGLHAVRALRGQLASLVPDAAGRFEIDYRLGQKEGEFQHAILMADDVDIETLANDGVVIPGQPLQVSVIVANRGKVPITVSRVSFAGLASPSACRLTEATAFGGRGGGGRGGRGRGSVAQPEVSTLGPTDVAQCQVSATIPPDARPSEPYWHRAGEAGRYTFDADAPFGLPLRPTPFTATVTLALPGGDEVAATQPLEYRYRGNIFSGEKRLDVLVVPAFSVRVSPDFAILPVQTVGAGGSREIRVTVVNDAPGAAQGTVRLELPAGWTATPPTEAVQFARADESLTARFQVKASEGAAPGSYGVRAVVAANGREFDRGFQVIEYEHIRRAHIYYPADVTVKVLDVKTAPNLSLGYVPGVGDEVPEALEQLGLAVTMLSDDDLAWGDLSKFNTIVMGVRAYERDPVRVNNSRLLDWVNKGGTLLVQYNRTEFNDAQYGPYPAQTSSDRVTDEFAPVTVLAPNDPVFNTPNKLTDAVWSGWVQERGTYYLGPRDPRYHDLIEMSDPFPYNPGIKRGALVETTYGQGHWIYTGLGLWRQVTAGTDGAYLILANLVSVGH